LRNLTLVQTTPRLLRIPCVAVCTTLSPSISRYFIPCYHVTPEVGIKKAPPSSKAHLRSLNLALRLAVIHLQRATISDFVIRQSDMVLECRVPLLQHDLLRTCSDLGCDKLLEVADSVVGLALYAYFLAETVVARDMLAAAAVAASFVPPSLLPSPLTTPSCKLSKRRERRGQRRRRRWDR
jgi:hypothetical protein